MTDSLAGWHGQMENGHRHSTGADPWARGRRELAEDRAAYVASAVDGLNLDDLDASAAAGIDELEREAGARFDGMSWEERQALPGAS